MNYFKEELMICLNLDLAGKYETKGSSINYCPFCGTRGDNGSPLDSISFEDIYEYNVKEFE